MEANEIVIAGLRKELDTAERAITSALWAARKEVDEERWHPRKAAPLAIERIQDATEYYDKVKQELALRGVKVKP